MESIGGMYIGVTTHLSYIKAQGQKCMPTFRSLRDMIATDDNEDDQSNMSSILNAANDGFGSERSAS